MYEMDFSGIINKNKLFTILEPASEVVEVEMTYFLIPSLIFAKSYLWERGSVKSPYERQICFVRK